MSEADTQLGVLDYLALKSTSVGATTAGLQDRTWRLLSRRNARSAGHHMCIEGQFVGIEVKAEKGKLNSNQEIFKEQANGRENAMQLCATSRRYKL